MVDNTSNGLFPTRQEEGFFHCDHCNHVIDLPPDADADQTHKCRRCHKWTVRWRFPSKPRSSRVQPRPVPAGSEVAAEAFARMRAVLEGNS
jgi:hypothetical protein